MVARLVTRDGKLVADVEIPPFKLLPEVLTWGTRTFRLGGLTGEGEAPIAAPVYSEVFSYPVPVLGASADATVSEAPEPAPEPVPNPRRQTCGRRLEVFGPWSREPDQDTWKTDRDGFVTCSFCGSIHPDDALRFIREGCLCDPTDKNYKLYLHAPDPKVGQWRIISMRNNPPAENEQGWVAVAEANLPELEAAGWGAGEARVGKDWFQYSAHGKTTEVKFYFQHFSMEQRHEFIELLNAGKINLNYPGHFYKLPYFVIERDPAEKLPVTP